MCPFREADGSVEQAGLEQREQPLSLNHRAPETATSVQGGKKAAKVMGRNGGSQSRAVRADTDNVSLSRFSLRMLYIDAVTEVSCFRPGVPMLPVRSKQLMTVFPCRKYPYQLLKILLRQSGLGWTQGACGVEVRALPAPGLFHCREMSPRSSRAP